ncbi:MAG TPA: hypothetical protein VHK02_14945 [Actinomycetota bacterium]|jgi:hypothetical protein|nr:hypothetical protein [Actinomycetota bacterium]
MRRRQIDVQVVARDERIGSNARAYARRKLASLARVAPAPVLYARVTLGRAADPGVARPLSAKALFDLNGRPVLARASARRIEEAVDLLEARLRHRLEHFAGRHRTGGRRP